MKTLIDEDYKLTVVFIGADKNCIYNNPLSRHANHSVNCESDLLDAMRTASNTMSSSRENLEYTPEGAVNITEEDILFNEENQPPPITREITKSARVGKRLRIL